MEAQEWTHDVHGKFGSADFVTGGFAECTQQVGGIRVSVSSAEPVCFHRGFALNPGVPGSMLFRLVAMLLSAAVFRTVAAQEPAALANTNDLPVILIEAREPIVSVQKVPCTMTLVMPADTARSTGAPAGMVRIHGASSQGYPKKSYAVSLAAPARWLGMRESSHWVLNAAFVDRSLMRHKLSYDLFRSLSTSPARRFSAASRFVEVRLNGNYQGAYLLMERVDRALMELRAFSSNAPSHACIYKAIDHAANFAQPGHGGFEQREPDLADRAYWEPLDELTRFVSQADDAAFRDPQKGIAARLDLGNAIDFHQLVLLTSNFDGITKNFIIGRDAVTTNNLAPRFFFVPWDYDGTFGRNWDASRTEPTAWLSNHLFDRLHGDAAFRTRFAARWKQLRTNEFSAVTIHRLIDENIRALGGAERRNTDHWRTPEGPYPDRLTPAQDWAQMKEWVVARLNWLDAEIERRK
jgi:hypothetical protein